eukprot:1385980-Rhodomonas_salina.1
MSVGAVGAGCEGKAREDGEGDPMGVTRLGWPPASCSDARCHQVPMLFLMACLRFFSFRGRTLLSATADMKGVRQSDSRASKAGAGEAAWAVPRHGAGGVGDGDQQGERGRDVSAGQDEQEAAQDPAALVRQAARRQRHEAPEPRKVSAPRAHSPRPTRKGTNSICAREEIECAPPKTIGLGCWVAG